MRWIFLACPTIVVTLYYVVVWYWWGRDPKPGTIVTRFDPPRAMSPALMRYCWKERFDERVIWAGLLSLVSRGLATLETREGVTFIKPVWPPQRNPAIPKEEATLYSDLATAKGRRGIPLSLTDDWLSHMSMRMAESLRRAEQGRWFVENRKTVFAGAALSLAALLFSVWPTTLDQLLSLVVPGPLIATSTFYLYFLSQRIFELARVASGHLNRSIAERLGTMLMLAIPCVAGIWIGFIVLYGNFGWTVLALVASLTLINLLFLHLMKAPTREGRKLLDEIEGFRHFLGLVEHLPMDRPEAPSPKTGHYEKYLPYALALEVEQQWCDQISAIGSSSHEYEEMQRSSVFHIGMWDGRPVEIAYRPQKDKGW